MELYAQVDCSRLFRETEPVGCVYIERKRFIIINLNRGKEKEDVVHIYNAILLSHKKKE